MLLLLAILVLIAWLLGFIAFHVASGFFHILLGLAIVLFVVHLIRAGSGPATP
jgi:hypothetical protein